MLLTKVIWRFQEKTQYKIICYDYSHKKSKLHQSYGKADQIHPFKEIEKTSSNQPSTE